MLIFVEQKRCESEWSEGVLWNATLAGTIKQEPCPAKQKGGSVVYVYIIYNSLIKHKSKS